MLPLAIGTSVINTLPLHDIQENSVEEAALCRAAAARGRRHAWLAALLPGSIFRRIMQRRMQTELDRALQRLSETSPHLLKDIGVIGGTDSCDDVPSGAEAGVEIVRHAVPMPGPRPSVRLVPSARHIPQARQASAFPAGLLNSAAHA